MLKRLDQLPTTSGYRQRQFPSSSKYYLIWYGEHECSSGVEWNQIICSEFVNRAIGHELSIWRKQVDKVWLNKRQNLLILFHSPAESLSLALLLSIGTSNEYNHVQSWHEFLIYWSIDIIMICSDFARWSCHHFKLCSKTVLFFCFAKMCFKCFNCFNQPTRLSPAPPRARLSLAAGKMVTWGGGSSVWVACKSRSSLPSHFHSIKWYY